MNSPSVEDEIFCLQYKLDMLSGLLIEQKTERWLEGCVYPATHFEHVQRYELACGLTAGKAVLDLACGVGQGSRMMATAGGAASIYAGDLEANAIRYARTRNARANITYEVVDALQFIAPERFDVAVCFETIEHVSDPVRLLHNFARSLKPEGQLLVSTPIAAIDLDPRPSNPYHVQEWGFRAFQALVSESFRIDRVFAQYWLVPPRVGKVRRLARKLRREFGSASARKVVAPESPQIRLEEWSQAGLPVEDFGRKWGGYQVLQCTPRAAVLP